MDKNVLSFYQSKQDIIIKNYWYLGHFSPVGNDEIFLISHFFPELKEMEVIGTSYKMVAFIS